MNERRVAGKPCKDVEFCYCMVPPPLDRECGPVINGYNGYETKQWEHNCKNYQEYIVCIEKTKDYCSPDRPRNWDMDCSSLGVRLGRCRG